MCIVGQFVSIDTFFLGRGCSFYGIGFAIAVLFFLLYTFWKKIKFAAEKETLFATQYKDLIKDVFLEDERACKSYMQSIDYVIAQKPKKAMPILTWLQQEAGTAKEKYVVFFFMTECYDILKKYEKEIVLCQTMIAIDADRVHAWYQMGTAYIMLEQSKEAIEALEQAAKLLTGEEMAADVYASLASAYVLAENYIDAKQYIDRAYSLNQDTDLCELNKIVEDALESLVDVADSEEVTPLFKRMVEMTGYPYEVFSYEMEEEEVMLRYYESALRGTFKNFVPILVSDNVIEMWMKKWQSHEGLSYDRCIKNRINRIEELFGKKEMKDGKWKELIQDAAAYGACDKDALKDKPNQAEYQDCFEGTYEWNVCLFEIPVKNPWEVLLYLPDSPFEENVPLEEIIALCKYWYEKAHALPAFISSEGIEFAMPDKKIFELYFI